MTTRFYWTGICPIGSGCRDWKQCLEGIPLIKTPSLSKRLEPITFSRLVHSRRALEANFRVFLVGCQANKVVTADGFGENRSELDIVSTLRGVIVLPVSGVDTAVTVVIEHH